MSLMIENYIQIPQGELPAAMGRVRVIVYLGVSGSLEIVIVIATIRRAEVKHMKECPACMTGQTYFGGRPQAC